MLLILLLLILLLVGMTAIYFIAIANRQADQGVILWTLAIALQEELPLSRELGDSLSAVGGAVRKKVRRLIDSINDGESLATALSDVTGLIPASAVTAAHIGEATGTLPQCLRDAAIRHQADDRWEGPSASSQTLVFAYLFALPVFALLIFQGISYFIIPKFRKIFGDFGTELPEETLLSLEAFDFASQYSGLFWLAIVVLIAIGGGIAHVYSRGWDEFDPPLIGHWLRRLDVPNLLRNLALAAESGTPLEHTLSVLAARHRRRAMRKALAETHAACLAGHDCWQALRDAGLLRDAEFAVLQSAQRVGNLPWALRQLAETIERRISYRWQTFIEFAQPAMAVGLLLFIGLMCLALFAPLVKLIQDLA